MQQDFAPHSADEVEAAEPDFDGPLAWAMFNTLVSANMLVTLQSHPTKKRMPLPGEVEAVTLATALRGEKITSADYVRATQKAIGSAATWRAFIAATISC